MPPLKYVVLLGSLPGEGMWSTADNYDALVAQIKEAYGEDYTPIFKYHLPCNPKVFPSPPDGNCAIIIDDADDFDVWRNGCVPIPHHRDALDDIRHPPTPLTTRLYVFRKPDHPSSADAWPSAPAVSGAPSPAVFHALDDVVRTPLHPLLAPLWALRLGVRAVLRHSAAAEAILLSGRNVSGAGEGHWGQIVRKAQSVWGVRRPAFRYMDLSAGAVAMSVFDARGYMEWSRSVGRERRELVVLENVFTAPRPLRADGRHALPLLMTPSDTTERGFGRHIFWSAPNTSAYGNVNRKCVHTCGGKWGTGEAWNRTYTPGVMAAVRSVQHGLFGPSFTTDGNIPPPRSPNLDTDHTNSLEHHQQLVTVLLRSGIV